MHLTLPGLLAWTYHSLLGTTNTRGEFLSLFLRQFRATLRATCRYNLPRMRKGKMPPSNDFSSFSLTKLGPLRCQDLKRNKLRRTFETTRTFSRPPRKALPLESNKRSNISFTGSYSPRYTNHLIGNWPQVVNSILVTCGILGTATVREPQED